MFHRGIVFLCIKLIIRRVKRSPKPQDASTDDPQADRYPVKTDGQGNVVPLCVNRYAVLCSRILIIAATRRVSIISRIKKPRFVCNACVYRLANQKRAINGTDTCRQHIVINRFNS